MSLSLEADTKIMPQPGTQNSRNGEVKVAEKSRQCPICHVYYKYGNSYWQHVRYVHASFLSQCVICEKSYKRTTMAKHHILHSHKIAWHLCSNYVRKIKKSDLTKNQHIRKEAESKNNNLKYFKKKTLHLISSFNCYDCSGSFATIDELFRHVKCHRGKVKYIDYEDEDEDEDVDVNDNDADAEDVKNVDIIQNDVGDFEDVDEIGDIEDVEDVEEVEEIEEVDDISHVNGVLGVDHTESIDDNHDIDDLDDVD